MRKTCSFALPSIVFGLLIHLHCLPVTAQSQIDKAVQAIKLHGGTVYRNVTAEAVRELQKNIRDCDIYH